jgi:glycosyltransferase involved in cell wall biosynthesis
MRIIARLNIGGPAIHVSLATAGLQDAAFSSILVTGQVGQAEGDMAYLAHELGLEPVIVPELGREISLLDDFKSLAALIRLMRRVRPHIVHTHTAKAGFLGRLAAFLSGVPVIVHTYHGHVFHSYFSPLKTRIFIVLEQLTALVTDAILTISGILKRDLLALHIAPAEKIYIIPLGLNLSPLSRAGTGCGTFRSELGYSADTPLVVIVGRLVPVKNHDLFLVAAQQVALAMPAVRFVVVGDGERRTELEALTSQLGLADVVCFTGWRRDLPIIYADTSVLVLTSHNEGTPVSILEAMAAGVPVVATAVGGVPDVLMDGRLGTLVPPDDPDAVARAILTALRAGEHPHIAEARDWVLRQYDSARLIADLRRLYVELLAKNGYTILQERGSQQ